MVATSHSCGWDTAATSFGGARVANVSVRSDTRATRTVFVNTAMITYRYLLPILLVLRRNCCRAETGNATHLNYQLEAHSHKGFRSSRIAEIVSVLHSLLVGSCRACVAPLSRSFHTRHEGITSQTQAAVAAFNSTPIWCATSGTMGWHTHE